MTDDEVRKLLDQAKADILAGGVASMTAGGKSVTFISLKDLQDFEDRENMKNSGPVTDQIVNAPYDPNW